MGEPPDTPAPSRQATANRLVRSEALVAELPDVFATTTFDPMAEPALAEVFMTGSQTTRLPSAACGRNRKMISSADRRQG